MAFAAYASQNQAESCYSAIRSNYRQIEIILELEIQIRSDAPSELFFVLYWCSSARGVLITFTMQMQNLMVNQSIHFVAQIQIHERAKSCFSDRTLVIDSKPFLRLQVSLKIVVL